MSQSVIERLSSSSYNKSLPHDDRVNVFNAFFSVIELIIIFAVHYVVCYLCFAEAKCHFLALIFIHHVICSDSFFTDFRDMPVFDRQMISDYGLMYSIGCGFNQF